MIGFPQSTAARVLLRVYLTSDHISPATGKTVAVQISKNGSAFANPSAGPTTATEISNGWYYVDLSTTDMGSTGPIAVRGTAASCDTAEWNEYVVNANNGGLAYLDAAVSSRASQTSLDIVDDYVDTEIAAIKAKTDNLPSDPADASDIAGVLTTINTKLDTTNGYIDTEVAAIKAKTDLIPATPVTVADIPTALQNADALLTRSISSVEGSAPVFSLVSVVLKLCSRFVASNGKTYRTNGTTVHMTQAVTTSAGSAPVSELGAAS
jgi:hypothetical protein